MDKSKQRVAGYLSAELIAAPTARLLANGLQARVLSVARRSVNLAAVNGEIIALTVPRLDPGPFALVVGTGQQRSFSFERILGRDFQEMNAVADDQILRLGQLRIHLQPATIWDPTLVQGQLRGTKPGAAIRHILRALYLCAPAESLPGEFSKGRDTEVGVRLRTAWRELRLAIELAEPWRCEAGARLAAGAGIGLTPAGDDFLMGALLALWLGVEAPGPYINSVLAGVLGRTGRLSTAFLRAAGRGEAGRAWHGLVESLVRGDFPNVFKMATVIVETGHTSGSDALFGFAKALEVIGRQANASTQPA